MKLQLSILESFLTIHRFPPNHVIPNQVYKCEFYSISKTDEELSIVCSSSTQLNSEKAEIGWSCIKVLGPLDFSLTGILADISAVLAEAEVSIFAVSTFDTDYILVKSEKLPDAKEALLASGYTFDR
ncbi:MAG: ACT domain-containing protein [Gammaproteobacteria bacterium]|nr:MAG: ACT domain-containing protein [Gammaproteobacteria bacterium]RLB67805.1 MAG: ACT domain-containing protein [Deltaproteobacteria bacterium]